MKKEKTEIDKNIEKEGFIDDEDGTMDDTLEDPILDAEEEKPPKLEGDTNG